MKHSLVYGLGFIALLAGCGSQPESQSASPQSKPVKSSVPTSTTPTPAPAKNESIVDAPLTYVARAAHAGEQAKSTIEISTLQKGIEMFQQEEGRNPKTLEELVQKSYIKIMPRPPAGMEFEYNEATANVKLVEKSGGN